MNVNDLDLRFDNRVLIFHAIVNTDRDPNSMHSVMLRAAKGPRLDASASWIEGFNDGAAAWAAMCRDRGIEHAFEGHYGGRVLAFHIVVNTDAEAYHIHKVILKEARGRRLDACVCWAEEFVGDDGVKVWTEIQKMAVEAAADPQSRAFSLFEDAKA